MKRFLALIIAAITVFSVFVFPTSAVNEPNAYGIGFEVDKSTVKWVGWYSEKTTYVNAIDKKNISHIAGSVRIQGVELTSKQKYLGYREDTWLTRTIIEPADVSDYWIENVTLFAISWKEKYHVYFSTESVSEVDPMPSGLKMSAHMSTTEANQITETVEESWTINGTLGLEYKGVSIGGGVGPTWTTTTEKVLATPYDSSRNDKEFNVKYDFLDPDDCVTEEQKSYCKKQCIIYSSKSLYGSKTNMSNYAFKTNVTVTFKTSYYQVCGFDNIKQVARATGSVCAYIKRAY